MITRAGTFSSLLLGLGVIVSALPARSGDLNKGADRQFDVESLPYAGHELQAVSGYQVRRNCRRRPSLQPACATPKTRCFWWCP